MDPFSAIGVAGNILAFIDFGFKALTVAREVYGSPRGTTSENTEVELLTSQARDLAADLQPRKPTSEMGPDELRLQEVAAECRRISDELLLLLSKLKAARPRSKRDSLGVVWRNIRKKDEKQRLEQRLDQCRLQLNLQLSQKSRLETISRLDAIIDAGQCHQEDLTSLRRNVEALRTGMESMSVAPEAQSQLQAVFTLSEKAYATVLQRRVLNALRVEGLNKRFTEVEEANQQTFRWILAQYGSESTGSEGKETVKTRELVAATPPAPAPSPAEATTMDQPKVSIEQAEAAQILSTWLLEGRGIFFVSGKPGAGKSTLMKFLCRSEVTTEYLRRWSGPKQLVLSHFFFWRPGSEAQNTLLGLESALLHSVLRQCPEMIPKVFPDEWETAKLTENLAEIPTYEVHEALKTIMDQPQVYEKHKFMFFIDGLDEYKGDHDKMIQLFFRWVSRSPDDIKLCVSSREWLIFLERFSKCPKLQLHTLTKSDMVNFIQDRISKNTDFIAKPADDQQRIMKLRDIMVAKAEGVFLWVSLAVGTLERCLLVEDCMEDMEKKIDSLPNELDDLFQAIFDSILQHRNPIDRKAALITLFLMITISKASIGTFEPTLDHPLLLFSYLDDFSRDSDFGESGGLANSPDVQTPLDERLRRARKQIYYRCNALAHVATMDKSPNQLHHRRETVAFIHRSIDSFLRRRSIYQQLERAADGFDVLGFFFQFIRAELRVVLASPTEIERVDTPASYYLGAQGVVPLSDRTASFQRDISVMINLSRILEGPETARLFRMLDTIKHIVTTCVPPRTKCRLLNVLLPYSWRFDLGVGVTMASVILVSHPSDFVYHAATQFGYTEYGVSRVGMTPGATCGNRETGGTFTAVSIFNCAFARMYLQSQYSDTLSALALKSVIFALKHGVNTNSDIRSETTLSEWARLSEQGVTRWQMLFWDRALQYNIRRGGSSEPALRAFLEHGADPEVSLLFVPEHGRQRHQGQIQVTALFGADKRRVFPPVYVPDSRSGIIQGARERGWILSLDEIFEYWHPSQASSLQELIRRKKHGKVGDGTAHQPEEARGLNQGQSDVGSETAKASTSDAGGLFSIWSHEVIDTTDEL